MENIDFVTLPKLFANSCVTKPFFPGSRWYVERGPIKDFRHWMQEINEYCPGNIIPFSWVPDYVGVSRSAVHKRAKNGGLTVLGFIVTELSQTILGGFKERETRKQYDFAFLSECRQWREILLERAGDE